ncbi:MAG: polysaccharide biosynthesis protein, partial [Clostridia bacterium]
MKKKFKTEMFTIRTLREWLMLGLDMFLIGVCFMASVILSQVYVFNLPSVSGDIITDAFIALPIVLVIYFVYFWLFRVSKVVWRYARGKDYFRIVLACILALFTFIILDEYWLHLVAKPDTDLAEVGVKYSVYPAYINFGISSVAATILLRISYEFFYSREKAKGKVRSRKRTMIIGAGSTANTILDELTRIDSIYEPICLLDDDPDKKGRILHEVEVVDDTTNIPSIVEKYGIEVIIFAIPSIDDVSRKRILNDCSKTTCVVKVLPYIRDIVSSIGFVRQMRDINIADLLGRAQISFDDSGVSKYIKDKVIMVTGGGGSIGSELCRQIVKYAPRRIVVVDVYENCVYDIQQELKILYGDKLDFCAEILSITDYAKVDELFEQYKPNIIFHAAAHKHVPLMETNPEEAVKNNVFGTLNVVSLADKHKVEKFIMISTDKAVNPTNVMGATKRCCEKIVQMFSKTNTTTEFAAVRFGNV